MTEKQVESRSWKAGERCVANRAEELFCRQQFQMHCKIDRWFAYLMIGQWLAGIVAAVVISPFAWAGQSSSVHIHVWAALVLGGGIASMPVLFVFLFPGKVITRHVIAVAQMLFSALFIHLTGGRIETHFHVFGSLAFLAFYRDWRVLPTATIIVGLDHVVRGVLWPQSVFGTLTASPWLSVEHAAWVVFEDIFLALSCRSSVREMRATMEHQAALEIMNENIEQKVTERTKELAFVQTQLFQAQKLESIGRLAAGMAHEINTPLQYITDNTNFVQSEFENLKELLGECDKLKVSLETAGNNGGSQPHGKPVPEELAKSVSKLDAGYLVSEIPAALEQSLEGLRRVKSIVVSMKEFSHPGTKERRAVDINRLIESAVTVSRNEWKYVSEMETDLSPTVPPVPCFAGDLSQVILNLVINAAQAIEETTGVSTGQGKGKIRVSTALADGQAEIRVSDTGKGIPDAIREKIFDPFFTTKEIGKGTGQGLALAHAVIVKAHQGTLSFETEVGKGTTFVIRLPLAVLPVEEESFESEGEVPALQ